MAKATLGDIEFNIITSEGLSHTADTTDHAVEGGSDISDHTQTKAPTMSINGALMGDDASVKLNQLKKYQKEGKLLRFTSRNIYGNMFITNLNTDHAVNIRNGFTFTMTLKQVRIAKGKEVEINFKAPPGNTKEVEKLATKVKPVVNKGRQQTVNKDIASVAGPQRESARQGSIESSMMNKAKSYKPV